MTNLPLTMSEKDYRLARFGEAMAPLRGRRVALYGTGVNASEVLARWGDELGVRIVVDSAHVGERCAGRDVVTLEDAISSGLDALVIAAKISSLWQVFERVRDACERSGVAVWDMYGNDLSRLQASARKASGTSWRQVVEMVGSHDVVCLNVACLTPEWADAAVDRRRHDERWQSVTPMVPFGESFVRGVHRLALAAGKQIVLVDEREDDAWGSVPMPLPEHDWLLTSREAGVYAENGLFRLVREQYPDASVMHVGPDPVRDLLYPRHYRIDTVCPQGESPRGRVPVIDAAPAAAGGSREAVLGDGCPEAARALAEVLGDWELAHPEADAASRYGALALGPLVAGFAAWLEASLERGEKDGVIFAARDGQLLKEAYDLLRESNPGLPASHYLRTSRLAATAPLLERPQAAYFVAESCAGMGAGEMLRRRFGLGDDEMVLGPGLDGDDYASRLAAIAANAEAIAAHAREARRRALLHLGGHDLRMGGRYAFVEFASFGTTELSLREYAPFELESRYLCKLALDSDEGQSYLDAREAILAGRYTHAETLMSSTEPSVDGYDEEGRPVFEDDPRPPRDLVNVALAHEAALEVVRGFAAKTHAGARALPPHVADGLFSLGDADIPMERIDSLTKEPFSFGEDASAPGVAGDPRAAEEDPAERSVHDVLMGLLATLDGICARHGLTYVAFRGTLLGAVRHAGMIPWDDDIDVAMPRGDFDRLAKLAPAELPRGLFLQTPESDPECFFGGYARLMDESTSAVDDWYGGRSPHQGIWMDIFPLDDCPASERGRMAQQRRVRTAQRLLRVKTYPHHGLHDLADADPKKLSAYFIVAGRLSRESLCRQLHRACTASRPTGTLTVFAGNYISASNRVLIAESDIVGCERVPFEDTTIPVPRNASALLRATYGPGYLELPPRGERVCPHPVPLDPMTPCVDTLNGRC